MHDLERMHHDRQSALCALQGNTGLIQAARECHVAIVKKVLAPGADATTPKDQVQSCCSA